MVNSPLRGGELTSEKWLRDLVKLIPDVVYKIDAKGNLVWLSPAFFKNTGFKPEAWLGKPFLQIIHPDDAYKALAHYKETLQGKKTGPFELRIKAADGSFLTGQFWGVPWTENGQIVGKVGIAHNITQTRNLEGNLQKYIVQLQELYNLSESLSRGSSNPDEYYESALNTIKRLFGADKAALGLYQNPGGTRFSAWNGVSKKFRTLVEGYFQQNPKIMVTKPIIYGDITKEVSLRPWKKDLLSEGIKALALFPITNKEATIGGFIVYFSSPRFMSNEEVNLGQTIGKHITSVINRRKAAEDIFNGIADGITIQDASGKLVMTNTAAAVASGYKTPEEMLKNPAKWVEKFDIRDSKGEKFDLSKLPGRRALMGEAEPEDLMQFRETKNGEVRWALVKARPLYDDNGKIYMAVNIIHDVTERMELEKKKDELISTASHELKTPLASLKGFVQVMELNITNPQNKYYLSKMHEQIRRLTKLVDNLLDVSRIESNKLTLQREKFNIVSLVEETAEEIEIVNTGYKIVVKNGIDREKVVADKYRISEVLYNLLSNAVKFSPKADKILVTIKERPQDVMVSVKDYGVGISRKDLKKVFQPFFQADSHIRQSFSGLGLGLYISSQIVKSHGGTMSVKSEKGKGTTFSFSLPLK